MTNVTVKASELLDLVGVQMAPDDLVRKVMMMGAGHEGTEGDLVTFDVFPARPDLYSVEGLARALRGYLSVQVGLPNFPAAPPSIDFFVDKSVEVVRPFAVGGIVRGVDLTGDSVASLVDLQEKLHVTLGRRRRKVAIGIHDLGKVVPPFTYKAVYPKSVRFVPLGLSEELDLQEILARHEKGKEFGPILGGKPLFPVIVDAKDVVLSFPPVINGIATQLTPETRDLFIDVTGTEFAAVRSALTILVTALSERGGRIERVSTVYPDRRIATPDLDTKFRIVDLEKASRLLGVRLAVDESIQLLRRMRYDAHAQGTKVAVEVPAYRTDILHDWDVYEDLAIAYGYDRFPLHLPRHQTIGDPAPLNDFSTTLRKLMVGYGYLEVMGLLTTSPKDPVEGPPRVRIENPVGEEFSAIRTSLLGSLLNILRLNTHRDLPQRVFEVGDVVVGGANSRRVGGAAVHPKASFTEMKSLIQGLLRDVGKACVVEPAEDPNYIPGRCAAVLADGNRAGVLGEVHPRLIEAYELGHPVGAFEIDVVPLH